MAVIYTYPLKSTPANNDLILISDSADKNKTKQVSIESINSLGVSKIIAGNNITISSTGTNGTGDVTINSTGGGGALAVSLKGSLLTSSASSIDLTGGGITAGVTGNAVTITVPPIGTINTGNQQANDVAIWDNANTITGTGSSTHKLQYQSGSLKLLNSGGANTFGPSFSMTSHSGNDSSSVFNFFKSRGPQTLPSAVLQNDFIGQLLTNGFDGSVFRNVASITSKAVSNFTSTSHKADLEFYPNFHEDADAKMTLKSDGNLEVQQVYSNNSIDTITLDSNSSSSQEFDGNTHLPTIKLSYADAAAPSAVTINFVNIHATIPYFIYISNNANFTGKTITFNYNGSANKIFFPSGTNLPLTVPSGLTLLQFNFLDPPSPGTFSVPSGFGTVIGTGYSA